MRSIKCAFQGLVKDARIRKTTSGKDYLSLDVEGGVGLYRIWVTTFHAIDELVDVLKPQSQVYVEGTIKIRMAESTPFFHVSATVLQPMFEINARPKPRAKKKDAEVIRGGAPDEGPAPDEVEAGRRRIEMHRGPMQGKELEQRAALARQRSPDYDAPDDEIPF